LVVEQGVNVIVLENPDEELVETSKPEGAVTVTVEPATNKLTLMVNEVVAEFEPYSDVSELNVPDALIVAVEQEAGTVKVQSEAAIVVAPVVFQFVVVFPISVNKVVLQAL
jgi:hypothetical protein